MRELLKQPATLWPMLLTLVGSLSLAGAAYAYVGWLGVGLVGLLGLVISVKMDLEGGHAVPDWGHEASAALLARQLAQREAASPEQKLALAEERRRRATLLYLANTLFIAMAVYGFAMFVGHDL